MESTSSDAEQKTPKPLRRGILIVAALVALTGLFYLEEDIRGSSAWNKFKRAEEANGEKFAIADYMPPAVPDEQNFAMTPLLRTTFDYVHTTNGIRWRDTKAWKHLSDIRVDFGGEGRNSLPQSADRDPNSPVDLEVFATFYRGNTNYPQNAHPGKAAEDVLTALNKFEPDLKELREAAATRPKSRFPIEYSYEPPSGVLLPHLSPVRGITSVCDIRAVAELETHHTDKAFADLQLGFRMSDSIRDEPFLIDHLVRIGTLNLTLQGIREGLARHAWSDSQLAEFGTNLASLDLLSEYGHAMRGERLLGIRNLDYFRRHGFKSVLSEGPSSEVPAFNWIPSGWYYQNMLITGEYYRDYILASVDASNRTVIPSLGGTMGESLGALQTTPYNFYAKLLLPAFIKASQRTAHAQTTIDEARIACALERYRLQHNDLPDSLGALTPQFISKIPNDLFDGKPLRYKKNPDGTYLLYSIGWNEIDDGGVVGLRNGSTPREDPNNGDWVWPSPAK
jgi:hypothetical protein